MPGGQSYRVTPAFHSAVEHPPVVPLVDARTDAARLHIATFLGLLRANHPDPTLPTIAQAAHVQDVLSAALMAEDRWQPVPDPI